MDNLVQQSKSSAYDLAVSASGLRQDQTAERALETRNLQTGSFGKMGKEILEGEEEPHLSAPRDQLTLPIETEISEEGLKIDKFEDGRTRAEAPEGIVREENPDGNVFISIPGGWLIRRDADGTTSAVNQYADESYPVNTLTEAGPDGPREVYEFTANGETHRVDARTLIYRGSRDPRSPEEKEKERWDFYFRENPEEAPYRGRPHTQATEMDGVLGSLLPLSKKGILKYLTIDEKKAKLAELAPDLSQLISNRPDITPGQAYS
ncbi:MAG: hypothetical protein HYU64_21955, partial [Armatimonadetes bacterium]|nr:hypothetical protein [Armatimonadota bacterium]